MADQALIKTIQAKFEARIRQNEMESLLHWRSQLEKIVATKPEGIASVQLQVKKVVEMMSNRIQFLKKEQREMDI